MLRMFEVHDSYQLFNPALTKHYIWHLVGSGVFCQEDAAVKK